MTESKRCVIHCNNNHYWLTMKQIGGSNAQLDMFEQTYIDVLSKSGHVARALNLLGERVKVINSHSLSFFIILYYYFYVLLLFILIICLLQSRPHTPIILDQLSNAYNQSGDKDLFVKYSQEAKHWVQYYKDHTPWHVSSA